MYTRTKRLPERSVFFGTFPRHDGEPDNERRRQRALFALRAYTSIDGSERAELLDGDEPNEELDEAIRDLITDLAHLHQDQYGDRLDGGLRDYDPGDAFDAAFQAAMDMFYAERADEEAEADEPELPEPDPDEEYDRLKADGELASVMRGRGL